MMYTLFITIEIFIAVLVVIVVLLQSSKGGGMAGITGGASNFGTMFGSRRTADFLSKATWWLGGTLLALAVVINLFFLPGQTTSEQRDSIIQTSREMQQAPTTPVLPTTPAASDENNSETPSDEK
ncbi:MAG: preprotein translocase subunit SecG [Bacteroidota bacterium]